MSFVIYFDDDKTLKFNHEQMINIPFTIFNFIHKNPNLILIEQDEHPYLNLTKTKLDERNQRDEKIKIH